ncbi:hypothetical protein GpartN1_g5561.t1 [Galdieria partita]|uniref:WH1 domain-containing protein n=1 Tax=Galdieria partita TaxID=83374 RepID=A0A9C7Q0E1_9RHOD|nr:hypothetical protein GpartN1_g5561.t1 [Galdieria partita]
MFDNSLSKSTSICETSITKDSTTEEETSQSNIEHFVCQVLGDNCSILGAVTTKAIYQAVCMEGNVEWEILGKEVVVAVSWEHKNCSSQSKRARFHCIIASTGRILLEEYISNESLYEVVSDTFHAYRIDQSQINSILGIQYVSLIDAQYFAEVLNNVLTLELHRKNLATNFVLEQASDNHSEASVSQHSVENAPEFRKIEKDSRTLDTTSHSRLSCKQRRPLSSTSSLHRRTSKGIGDNYHAEGKQVDIFCNPNPDKSFLVESNSIQQQQYATLDHSFQKEMVFQASRQKSKIVDHNGNSSDKEISLDSSSHCEQRNSFRQLSQVPFDLSRCTVSEKQSLSGTMQNFQRQNYDTPLLPTTNKTHSGNNIISNNSNPGLHFHDMKTKVEHNSCFYNEGDNSIRHSTSTSTSKSSVVMQTPETKLPPPIIYENLLIELNLVAHERIQEFIQGLLREGPFNRSTEKFCKSRQMTRSFYPNQ